MLDLRTAIGYNLSCLGLWIEGDIFLFPTKYYVAKEPSLLLGIPPVNLSNLRSNDGSFAFLEVVMTAKDGKPCKKCGTSAWHKAGHCVACKRKHDRRWRAENPDKAREASRRWKEDNPDKVVEHTRQWHQNNPVRSREKSRQWKQENPDRHVIHNQKRRARKAEAAGFYTAADWNAIVTAQAGRCLACGKKEELTVDHIVPLDKGGTNWPDNLQGLCRSCNSKKGTKTIDYRKSGGFLRWIQKNLF